MKRARWRTGSGQELAGEWTDGCLRITGRTYARDDVELLPPVRPGKVIGVTPNHPSQFEGDDPPPLDVFLKPASSVVGPDRTVELPLAEEVIYEAELGVVIGRTCRAVGPDEAMAAVAGFTCVNDLTKLGERTLNRQKVFDGATPMGPVVASPDGVPADATIEMRVNGELEQQFSRTDYVHRVADVVAEVSSLVTLEPDDVLTMGTGRGIGELADGDETEVSIEGVGSLRTVVADAG